MELTKAKLQTKLKYIDKEVVTYMTKGNVSVDLTLREAIRRGLTGERPNDKSNGEERIKCAILADRIYNADKYEVTSEEVVLIKERCNSFWSAEIALDILKHIDNASVTTNRR